VRLPGPAGDREAVGAAVGARLVSGPVERDRRGRALLRRQTLGFAPDGREVYVSGEVVLVREQLLGTQACFPDV